MNNSFQALQALIDNKIITLSDYYSVNVRKWGIDLQGVYSSDVIRTLSIDYGVKFKIDKGYATGKLEYTDEKGGAQVQFTFT